jgi:hypothetical protein
MRNAWGRRGMCTWFWWGNTKKRDPRVNVRIILKWVLRQEDGRAWTVFIWLRTGCCEKDNEHSAFTKRGKFLYVPC